MLHYPEIMKKAQDEIDSVVASNRLPEFEDADALPYVRAMIKEIREIHSFHELATLLLNPFHSRWRPIAPMGVPHSVISDDVYEGMQGYWEHLVGLQLSIIRNSNTDFFAPQAR